MIQLSKDFFKAVLTDVRQREDKLAHIANILETFFNAMKAYPVADEQGKISSSLEPDETIKMPNVIAFIARSYRDESEDYKTQLEIILRASGSCTLVFSGDEFDADGEEYDFDLDGYTPEHAVSKILTMIQDGDITEMGPHVSQTMKTIWASYLKQPLEAGPGFEPVS